MIPSQPALIGLDLGTTVVKSLVFGRDLRILGNGRRDIPLIIRSSTEIEQDPECWWRKACEAVRESIRAADCDPRGVQGISIGSQGITFVPADDCGRPLRPALSWLDMRAGAQSRRVLDTIGERAVFRITGKRCHEAYVLPKLLWIRDKEPDVYRACRRILMPHDFLLARLTGEFATDHTMASGTMLYDLARLEWSADILNAFVLDPRMLPTVRWSGTPIGTLRPAAADELGLPRSVVVSVGGQDQKVAAMGAGIDGESCTISLGTAIAITRQCTHPAIDKEMRIPCFTDIRKDQWVLEGSSLGCSILDWARRTLFAGMSHDELNRIAAGAADQANPPYLFPFFSGPITPFRDSGARGMLYGLNLSTTPGQIVRSIFEGIAFVIRANLEVIEELARPVRDVRIFGGGSRSEEWCRIIADVVQRPLWTTGTSECAARGAAILAGTGVGMFANAEEAARHLAPRMSYEPRASSSDRYEGMYAEFNSLRSRFQADAEAKVS